MLDLETAPTFAFSHSQYTSVQSGAPPCVSSPLESGEKARHTNSLDITSLATAWSTFRRLSVCRSKTVTSAFSPSAARSATATYFLFGLTAIAVMPSVFSVPEMNRCVFCSVLKITTLWPAG